MLSGHLSLTHMLQYINIAHFNKIEEIQVHMSPDSSKILMGNTI
jgi:hypothetical protein